MTFDRSILESEAYDFIKTNPHLGDNIMFLGLSGSISYGTNNENSDIDLRGVTLNRKSDLIGLTSFEQYVDNKTDTCIYGFNKMMKLLINCNPNTIELLGLKPEHYLYMSDIGKELISNRKMFLSKVAIQSFGGYASAQLRRLQNALARDVHPQPEREQHILSSVNNAMYEIKNRYTSFGEGGINLYIDKSSLPELETEIYMDTTLKRYPLRDYKNIWSEMNSIVKAYDKIGKRNKKKDDNHLNKHAMHLIRLFMMAIDILENEEICTYRERELGLLMKIRNGEFQDEKGLYNEAFYELLAGYEKRLDYAGKNTCLPDTPNMKVVEAFIMSVNERVVRGEV